MNSLRGDYFLESSDAAAATLSSIPTFTRSSISRVLLCWPLAILKLFKKLISVYSKCPSCPSIFWGKGLVYQIFKKNELYVVLSRPVSVIFFRNFLSKSSRQKTSTIIFNISFYLFRGPSSIEVSSLMGLFICSHDPSIINYNLFLKK